MSQPTEQIPSEMLAAAKEAAAAKGYCSKWSAEKIAEAALEAAGVPALQTRIAELEAELATLREFEVTNRAQWQALLAKAEADRDFAKLQAADNAALTEKVSKYAAHLLAENERLKSESGIEAKPESGRGE